MENSMLFEIDEDETQVNPDGSITIVVTLGDEDEDLPPAAVQA